MTSDRSGPSDRLAGRQYIRFAFYQLDLAWRRLPPDEQAEHKRELNDSIEHFARRMLLRPYSLMGTRADVELLLWQIAETPLVFQELATAIARTRMGGYLRPVQSYFSQTKRSVYEIRDADGADHERPIIEPSEAKYLFVYPFVKTRDWYQLSGPTRQGIMDEHIQVGRKYPSIRLNTTYCFGLDDYEFVVAFETDEPSDFLDLVQDLRLTESSRYTLQDTPIYSCLSMRLPEALDALGGPPVAVPVAREALSDTWTEVCALADVSPGGSRVEYVANRQVAVFNVDGGIYAIGNRCTHARGPLSEGVVECDDSSCTVTCPWHDTTFDLASGQVVDGIAAAPVQAYAVEVRDGAIFVRPAAAAPVAMSAAGAAR